MEPIPQSDAAEDPKGIDVVPQSITSLVHAVVGELKGKKVTIDDGEVGCNSHSDVVHVGPGDRAREYIRETHTIAFVNRDDQQVFTIVYTPSYESKAGKTEEAAMSLNCSGKPSIDLLRTPDHSVYPIISGVLKEALASSKGETVIVQMRGVKRLIDERLQAPRPSHVREGMGGGH